MSDIVEFYRGKHVLITGAAGFIGSLTLERLLRVCDVEKLYLLLRPKKGTPVQERLKQILKTPVFDRLWQSKPEFVNKIQLVEGDTSVIGLGLSASDRTLLVENVNVVFHGAAIMGFNEDIKSSTATNVRGTVQIIELCKEMKHLKAFVHVSTAFSNCNHKKIDEKFYEPPMRAEEIIRLCEFGNEELLERAKKKEIQERPNYYLFTKSVAEDAVRRLARDIPACVFRPSIIVSTNGEPFEGWIDNYYGLGGYMLTVLVGLVRVANIDPKVVVPAVPADMCVSVLLAAAYKTSLLRPNDETKIYNFTPSSNNEINYGKCVNLFLEAAQKAPLADTIWYPQVILCKSTLYFTVMTMIIHMIPALFVDLLLTVQLSKPKAVKKMLRIKKALSVFTHFTLRTWTYSNDNLKSLWSGMSTVDKALFNFDMNGIDWKQMITINYLGLRKYLLKQPEGTIPVAKKKMFWLFVGDKIVKGVLLLTSLFTVVMLATKKVLIY